MTFPRCLFSGGSDSTDGGWWRKQADDDAVWTSSGFILVEVKLILLCCCNKFEMQGENVIGTLFGGLIYHPKSAVTGD